MQAIQGYLRPGDVLYVDNGTSFTILGLKLPAGCTFVGSINWGSIGYSVGALLGALTAAPAPIISSSNKGAELDYGPRGPQHRDDLQLRPTAA